MFARFNNRRLAAIAVILAMSVLFITTTGIVSMPASGADNDSSGNDVTAKNLTVQPGDLLPDIAKCSSDELLYHSVVDVGEGDSSKRQWSDAVSIPFVSSDADEIRTELFAEHCANPTELTMSIEALQRINVDSHNIGELNPWMDEYLTMAESPGMRESFLTFKEDKGETIFVTKEYQEYAAMTNTLLTAFQVRGVEAKQSVENWHLPAPEVGELPRAVLNDQQEGLPALVMEYTAKHGCPLVAFGYNVGDKRFELFEIPKCEVPPETTKPPTKTTTPSTTPSTTPGTTPPPTTPPPTTPPPTTTVVKDHTQSPISDDRNDPNEVVRPNIPAPPVVIRPPDSKPTQPPPPSTIPDPPEVQNPKPVTPGSAPTTPALPDPVDNGDTSGDGIPD